MDFHTAVRHAREKMGMSQEELAHALKVSFATINRWENGKTHPNKMAKSVFFDLCEKQGIDVKTLL